MMAAAAVPQWAAGWAWPQRQQQQQHQQEQRLQQEQPEVVCGIDCGVAVDTCSRAEVGNDVPVFPFTRDMPDDVRDLYTLGREIGRGSYGIVRECFHRQRGEMLAAKIISKSLLRAEQDRKVVAREVGLMMSVAGHPGVVSLHGAYEDSENVYIVMEHCSGGELYDRILQQGKFPEADAADVFRQLVDAVSYCHSKGIVHRDLKPENVLLCVSRGSSSIVSGSSSKTTCFSVSSSSRPSRPQQPQQQPLRGLLGDSITSNEGIYQPRIPVKLVDFGLGVLLPPGAKATARIGSLMYESPEVWTGRPYDAAADMWSLGVILFALLSGSLPFVDADPRRLGRKVCEGAFEMRFSPWPFVSDAAKGLVRRLLSVDPSRRPTAAEVLRDPWLLAHFPDLSAPASATFNGAAGAAGAARAAGAAATVGAAVQRMPSFAGQNCSTEELLSQLAPAAAASAATAAAAAAGEDMEAGADRSAFAASLDAAADWDACSVSSGVSSTSTTPSLLALKMGLAKITSAGEGWHEGSQRREPLHGPRPGAEDCVTSAGDGVSERGTFGGYEEDEEFWRQAGQQPLPSEQMVRGLTANGGNDDFALDAQQQGISRSISSTTSSSYKSAVSAPFSRDAISDIDALSLSSAGTARRGPGPRQQRAPLWWQPGAVAASQARQRRQVRGYSRHGHNARDDDAVQSGEMGALHGRRQERRRRRSTLGICGAVFSSCFSSCWGGGPYIRSFGPDTNQEEEVVMAAGHQRQGDWSSFELQQRQQQVVAGVQQAHDQHAGERPDRGGVVQRGSTASDVDSAAAAKAAAAAASAAAAAAAAGSEGAVEPGLSKGRKDRRKGLRAGKKKSTQTAYSLLHLSDSGSSEAPASAVMQQQDDSVQQQGTLRRRQLVEGQQAQQQLHQHHRQQPHQQQQPQLEQQQDSRWLQPEQHKRRQQGARLLPTRGA